MIRLAQHFLKDANCLKLITQAADLKTGDFVMEIGAGKGVLTKALLKKGAKVTAVEKDSALAKELTREFIKDINSGNLIVIKGDVRDVLKNMKFKNKWKLVGSIPYYLTGQILRFMTDTKRKPLVTALMVQKEVAEKIVAKPPRMNMLAAIIALFYKTDIATFVPKNAFTPEPKIDSAILSFDLLPKSEIFPNSLQLIEFIKAGFRQPRKILLSNLQHYWKNIGREKLEKRLFKFKMPKNTRAQELTVKNWADLYKSVNKN